MNLQPATIDKLGKLFPRLASDHDGEVVATARAIIRTLQSAGKSLHDLGAAMTPIERIVYQDRVVYRDMPEMRAKQEKQSQRKPRKPRKPRAAKAPPAKPDYSTDNVPYEEILELADRLLDCGDLNEWETNFVSTIKASAARDGYGFTMSPKQTQCWRATLIKHKIVGDPA